MRSKKLIIVKCMVMIVFITVLSFMYYLTKPITTPKIIFIQNGSIYKIISQLQLQYNEISLLDAYILRLLGNPQSGWINLHSTTNTKLDFLYKLTTAKAALVNVTLIPGETSYLFLQEVAKTLKLDFEQLYRIYTKKATYKEGMFVPNTYSVPMGINETEFLDYLLKISQKTYEIEALKFFKTYNSKKWYKYITIASIIEKESANVEEMPLVSSVIYNRIRRGMRLQMDGTLNYGKYSHIKITAKRLQQDKSKYNTYLYSGLPPAPVCNVSKEAINAAIFPKKTKYLYFMKNKKGTHDFTSYYSTHLKNIKHATK